MNKDGLETIVNFLHQEVRQLLKECRELKQLFTSNKETIKIQVEYTIFSLLLNTYFSRSAQFQIKLQRVKKQNFPDYLLIFTAIINSLFFILINDNIKRQVRNTRQNKSILVLNKQILNKIIKIFK